MSWETVQLSHKESERARVLAQVEAGGIKLVEAAEIMAVSYRHAKRLLKDFRKLGLWGLAHGLRGKRSNRRSDDAFRQQVLARYRERYLGFGPTLAQEKLAGEGLRVGRETLRVWLKNEHLWLGRQVERTHRRRRPRRERFGELVQMDGSDHAWLEDRGPRCCLMVMIDDATGRVHARFGPSENLLLARQTLAGWIERFGGIPHALYTDRLSLYYTDRAANEQERHQGSRALTDFGRICLRLGIGLIPAGSPQAKGRVERMNGTLQDRLVKELRLAGASTIDEANALLEGGFLDRLNERFGREPLSPVDFHRRLDPKVSLNEALSLEATRQVQNDWTLTYGSRTLQVLPGPHTPRPKSRVRIQERLDGTLALLQGDHEVAFREINPDRMLLTKQSPSPRGGWAGEGADGRPRQAPLSHSPRAGGPGTCGPAPARGGGHF
jgi:transposase